MHSALLDAVSEELEAWDGQNVDPVDGRAKFATLRICARVDRISRRVQCTVRCKLGDRDDDSVIALTHDGSNHTYDLERSIGGWSTPLAIRDNTESVDAATLDWINGVTLRSDLDGLTVRLTASRSRILVSGASEGLPDLLEVNQLPPTGRFYVLVPAADQNRIEVWGQTACRRFTQVPAALVEQLPPVVRPHGFLPSIGRDQPLAIIRIGKRTHIPSRRPILTQYLRLLQHRLRRLLLLVGRVAVFA